MFAGFYARVTNADEIEEKVFEYVKVLARPMVLYQHDHPIHWTPTYVGGKVRALLTVHACKDKECFDRCDVVYIHAVFLNFRVTDTARNEMAS